MVGLLVFLYHGPHRVLYSCGLPVENFGGSLHLLIHVMVDANECSGNLTPNLLLPLHHGFGEVSFDLEGVVPNNVGHTLYLLHLASLARVCAR